MWEAIRKNRRRSIVLILFMGVLLLMLGAMIGVSIEPRHGLYLGLLVAFFVWGVQMTVAFTGGDRMLLGTAGAREIEKTDHPQLWNVVEEMTIASGLGKMPRVYIMEEPAPNAFAVGRNPDTAAVAVTSGLLERLNRDELQGVIAHEIAHVKNYDIRYMTIAAVMMGSIVILSDLFLRGLIYSGGTRRVSARRRGGGQEQIVFVVVAIVAAILAPLAAQMLYFACSREREYLADASAARFTRYPEGLASALEKIAGRVKGMRKKSRTLAPMYIVNPLQKLNAVGLFSTHPPIGKRVQILRSMAGAGYADYANAYKRITGSDEETVGRAAREDEQKTVPLRQATPEPEQTPVDKAREVHDLLAGLSGLIFVPCACGVNIKLPPNFGRESVKCPRCGRANSVHKAVEKEEGSDPFASPGSRAKPVMRYERQGRGWESFKCSCGQVNQISPAFSAPHMKCRGCGRRINIL